MLKL
jgi:Ran GTPase-activating protein (RanGAP) involved in mRNA processing and transport